MIGESPLHWLVSFPEAQVDAIGAALLSQAALESYALASGAFIAGIPLHRAVALRRIDVTRFLLMHGTNPFYTGTVLFDPEKLLHTGYEGLKAGRPSPYLPVRRACQAHNAAMLYTIFSGHGRYQHPEWPSNFQLSCEAWAAPNMPSQTWGDLLLPVGYSMKKKHPTEFAKAAKM